MLIVLKIAVGILTTLVCSALPWGIPRIGGRVLAAVLGGFAAVAAAGAVIGLALFPFSDAIVLGAAVSGGVLLGRALPTRFTPVLIVLIALSLLDLAQAVLLSGPPTTTSSTQSSVPNPHLIWVNFRVPLPSGHFNIGVFDLLLVAALAENFRRRGTSWAVAAIPGVFALITGTLIASAAGVQRFAEGAFSEALIPYLAVGWLLGIAVAGSAGQDVSIH